MNFEEAETVAYTGARLAELLASPPMTALPDLEISVEHTVVIAGSRPRLPVHDATPTFSTTFAPVVCCEPPSAEPRSTSKLVVAMIGLVIGSGFGLAFLSEAQAAPVFARHVQRHERVEQTRKLVVVTSPMASAKRPRRLGMNASAWEAPRPSVPAPTQSPAPTSAEEAAADQRLIRAALSERSL